MEFEKKLVSMSEMALMIVFLHTFSNGSNVKRSKNGTNREATTDDLSEGDLEQLLLENCAIFIID